MRRFVPCSLAETSRGFSVVPGAAGDSTGSMGVGVADADGANVSTGVGSVPGTDDDVDRGGTVGVAIWG